MGGALPLKYSSQNDDCGLSTGRQLGIGEPASHDFMPKFLHLPPLPLKYQGGLHNADGVSPRHPAIPNLTASTPFSGVQQTASSDLSPMGTTRCSQYWRERLHQTKLNLLRQLGRCLTSSWKRLDHRSADDYGLWTDD